MKYSNSKNQRVLGVAPSTRGFGFAVIEKECLIDWGIKCVSAGNKNPESLVKFDNLIEVYQPAVIVLEDHSGNGSRRSERIRKLGQEMRSSANAHRMKVKVLSRREVRKIFFAEPKGTKHCLAEMLTKRFPEELSSRLPRKRRPWESESHGMGIFEAVGLALALHYQEKEALSEKHLNED
jgi:hypothetical protein